MTLKVISLPPTSLSSMINLPVLLPVQDRQVFRATRLSPGGCETTLAPSAGKQLRLREASTLFAALMFHSLFSRCVLLLSGCAVRLMEFSPRPAIVSRLSAGKPGISTTGLQGIPDTLKPSWVPAGTLDGTVGDAPGQWRVSRTPAKIKKNAGNFGSRGPQRGEVDEGDGGR